MFDTAQVNPAQTEIDYVNGRPEGRDYASPGRIAVDVNTGVWWRKTTRIEYNTGWRPFGGSFIRVIYNTPQTNVPAIDPAVDNIVYDAPDNLIWVYEPITATWYSVGGSSGVLNQIVVPTVAELRMVDTSTITPVWARTYGAIVPFDPQGSEYGWDPDLIVDDNGDYDNGLSVVKPDNIASTDPGRWRMLA